MWTQHKREDGTNTFITEASMSPRECPVCKTELKKSDVIEVDKTADEVYSWTLDCRTCHNTIIILND